jgi:hypothetical protein
MGGQACILYGAAEFSRDIDVVVLADVKNLERLRKALRELRAELVFVPALDAEVLRRGHACHFRARAGAAAGLRIDVMSVLRGCAPFEELWTRRRVLTLPGVGRVNVLSLIDLVQAKKTQRDKDWPMVRRLVEADYHARPRRPTRSQIDFWLREARTGTFLQILCRQYSSAARRLASVRPSVRLAVDGASPEQIDLALRAEEEAVRAADRAYWQPRRAELAQWRRAKKQLGQHKK